MVLDLASGHTRVVASGAGAVAAWSHDGRRVIYQVGPDAPGGAGMWWKPLDASAPPERLTSSKSWQQPQTVTRSGRWLIYQESVGFATRDSAIEENYDVWILPLVPRGEPRPLLRTKANERLPHVSMDERWLAYVSDESGQDEVWVRACPDGAAAIQVSQAGGTEPLWAPDGRRLYYRDGAGTQLFAVPVAPGVMPQFSTPAVTTGFWQRETPFVRMYDITPDGNALLMVTPLMLGRELHVVLNFDDVIRRKMSAVK
jgi:Tol biopolymer transport system component